MPIGYEGIQSAMLEILSLEETCFENSKVALARKAVVTLGPDNYGSIVLQLNWFEDLDSIFCVQPFLLEDVLAQSD